MGPGDWAVGLTKVAVAMQQAGNDIKLGYIGFDHRDHVFSISRIRLINYAMDAFNSCALVVEGMSPVPSDPESLAPGTLQLSLLMSPLPAADTGCCQRFWPRRLLP